MKTPRRLSAAAATFTGSIALSFLLFFGEGVTPSDLLPEVGSPGGPDRLLSPDEAERWLAGRLLFDHDFHSVDGLGSDNGSGGFDFNGDSCRACHIDPVIGGAGGLDLNVSRCGSDLKGAGPFTNVEGGQILSKLRRPGSPGRENFFNIADVFELRQTPTLHGAGLIDSIPASEILSNTDAGDTNGDGIFGVARIVTLANGTQDVGRFGWKAQVPSVSDFVRDAMGGEIGITVPPDSRGFGIVDDQDGIPDPELSQGEQDDLAFFISHLARPQRKGSTDPRVSEGQMLFQSVGCAVCHRPTMMGSNGPVPLYSNLLLHNVQDPTFRGMAEPGAERGLYRTPPLWGISATAPYMHDGHAETLRDAIQAHDSEAAGVRAAFNALSTAQQDALILFLADL